MNFAVVFAAGVGVRMGSETPKQFLPLDGVPVLLHTLMNFERHPMVDGIYLVVNANWIDHAQSFAEEGGRRGDGRARRRRDGLLGHGERLMETFCE